MPRRYWHEDKGFFFEGFVSVRSLQAFGQDFLPVVNVPGFEVAYPEDVRVVRGHAEALDDGLRQNNNNNTNNNYWTLSERALLIAGESETSRRAVSQRRPLVADLPTFQ